MTKQITLITALSLFFFAACTSKPDPVKQIAALEQALASQYTVPRADSLLALYAEMVKNNPDDQANNYRYLVAAAKIQMLNKQDAVSAARNFDTAINQYGKGQNHTEVLGLMLRMWRHYNYKSDLTINKLQPEDVDLLQANIQKNLVWADSSILSMDRQITQSAGIPDKKLVDAFIEASEGFGYVLEKDSPLKCSDILMKAAGLAKTANEPNKALQLYNRILSSLPPHPRQPSALFMTGFIFANDLNDLNKAKEIYQEFLQKYPQDPLAESARSELKNLGKTPEQIIQEISK